MIPFDAKGFIANSRRSRRTISEEELVENAYQRGRLDQAIGKNYKPCVEHDFMPHFTDEDGKTI